MADPSFPLAYASRGVGEGREGLGLMGNQQQEIFMQYAMLGLLQSNNRQSQRAGGRKCNLLDCLELVAKIDLSSQNLEQDNHLLIWQLTVLCDQGQNGHRGKLAPVQPCTDARTV